MALDQKSIAQVLRQLMNMREQRCMAFRSNTEIGEGERGAGPRRRAARQRKGEVINIRQDLARRRDPLEKTIVRVGRFLTRPRFFATMLVFHVAWVVWNSLPGVPKWDPYPYMLLATIASAEAPFLALLILMSQDRELAIQELRDEMTLQTDLHAEHEASRLLQLVDAMAKRMGVTIDDLEAEREIEMMKEPINPEHLREDVERELSVASDEEDGER